MMPYKRKYSKIHSLLSTMHSSRVSKSIDSLCI